MIEGIKYDERGLVPVIVQDHTNNEVLMLAYMNEEALEATMRTGQAVYYSRSRGELWHKGETSGHFQDVKGIRYDCDCDTLLLLVEQRGSACHTGNRTCFYRELDHLRYLHGGVKERMTSPKEGSYTNYLLDKGIDKILKKVGEESAEVIIAAKNADRDEIANETADLMYHLSVMLAERGLSWDDVYDILEKRRK